MKTYKVVLRRVDYAWTFITAPSQEEAERLAKEEADRFEGDWDAGGEPAEVHRVTEFRRTKCDHLFAEASDFEGQVCLKCGKRILR